MKALIYPWVPENFWSREIFPGLAPTELNVIGKSWCWCAVDCCSVLKISEVLIADCNFSPRLEAALGSGTYWSLKLSYLPGVRGLSAAELPERYRDFAGEDDLLVVKGLLLPDVQKPEEVFETLRPVEADEAVSGEGVWLRRGGRFYEVCCPLLRLDNLKEYFDVNFRLLGAPGIYALPGYSGQDGINIGMNVIMMSAGKIEAPVIINDDVCLGWGVAVRNGAVIGRNVLVDENTLIEHSLVLGNTYIGRNMSFRNKIVSGSRVIDPLTGSYEDLEDDILLRSIEEKWFDRYRVIDVLLSILLAVAEMPLYLVTRPFRRWLGGVPFFKFFFTIYPRYWSAVVGRRQLVRRSRICENYVFRGADLWPIYESEEQKAMADEFYIHHRSLRLTIAVCLGSLIKRMFVMIEHTDQDKTYGAGIE